MGWKLVFELCVPGEPVAKGRPRATRRGNHVRMYTPAAVKRWEDLIAFHAACELGRQKELLIPEGPVYVQAEFTHSRPKRLLRKKDPDDRVAHDRRPDADNCLKALLDGLSKAALWKDDSQVSRLAVTQWYAEKSGAPRTEVRVFIPKEW